MPVNKFAGFFTEDFGRPTKELYAALGSLLIQQMHDLTDEETVSQFSFNIQWHYALDIPGESDESKYLSLKTLWKLRNLVMREKLDVELFNQTTEALAKAFQVDTTKQRIDSVHIRSNMRRLGRIGIFSQSIHTFLVNLKRRHPDIFETIDKELVNRYLSEKALSCFSLVKPTESGKTLEGVARDLFALVRLFEENDDVKSLHSYNTLLRVLKNQCRVTEAKDDQPEAVEVIPPKEVPSDSLQNPSDPDAGYSGHKGQGYQAQVMETYCDSKDEDIRGKTLNLITHVDVESACIGDVHALIPALESTSARDLAPAEVLADSLYGSDDNCEKAREMGIDIISPTMGTPKEKTLSLADFHQSEKGIITACPQGHAPVRISTGKKQKHGVAFASEQCNVCPLRAQCPVKEGKNDHYLYYDIKAIRIAKRRAMEYSPQFKDKYRWRSGIEATFSAMDKTTGVKRLRVRGLSAVSYFARLKAIAVNIFRATSVRNVLTTPSKTPVSVNSGLLNAKFYLQDTIFVFKEQFLKTLGLLATVFTPPRNDPPYELKTAA
ncbi:MAG: transposase [Syntrophobacterales bacterium]|nr:transposase [Syntrophobacterales bacterium]